MSKANEEDTSTMSKSIILLALIALLSCEKDEIISVGSLTGTYTGSFSRTSPYVKYKPSDVILTFDGNTFQGSSSTTKYPAICNGTYTIASQVIEFNNLCVWTAEFDWSYILSGKFKISIKGDELTMTRTYDDVVHDTYSLRRQ